MVLSVNLFSQDVQFGIDQPSEFLPLLKNKRVGIVANHTSIDKFGRHLIKILDDSSIFVTTIFAPEHGFKGDLANGKYVKSDLSKRIISLYGKHKKPSPSDLKNIDILIYDIQDLGARFYTYISTLGYVMEACAETNTRLIVLDRPTLLSGERVEGTVLNEKYYSFIGMYPIPVIYGLTIGEFAKTVQGENWMNSMHHLKLDVIELNNWDRTNSFKLNRFIPPSPNIPSIETAHLYASLCYLEGTNVSEGRGTNLPFRQIGAPWFKAQAFIKELKKMHSKTVKFQETTFIPRTIKGKAWKPKFENEACSGVKFTLKDINKFQSQQFGISVLHALQIVHPERFKIDRQQHFERLIGSSYITTHLDRADYISLFRLKIQKDESMFQTVREKYMMY